jgi:hypothetical protein
MDHVKRPMKIRHPRPLAHDLSRVTCIMEALLSRIDDLFDPDVVNLGSTL